MHQAMPTDIQERCDKIEACYEFTLSYAAQGLPTDEGSPSGKQLREQLARWSKRCAGLSESYAAAMKQEQLAPADRYQAFFAVLARDATSALVAIELVLAQPAISSQLIDNLNASMHLRALLTDLFLITEILRAQGRRALQADHQCTLLRFSITSSIHGTPELLPILTLQCRLRIRHAAMF